MTDHFEVIDTHSQEAVIKVIGVGGCGGNAVDHMIDAGIAGVEFICANTDAQALRRNKAKIQLQLGANVTKGLGAGADPEKGKEAALEDQDRLAELIQGSDMLFLTAGMGGGTGTGAAPIVAKMAKDLGILTVAVVTKPFAFEGRRQKIAMQGLADLSQDVDSLIVIPNDKLMTVLGEDVTMLDAFKAANGVLHDAVSGISQIIKNPGQVNVDFADVKTVMSEMGMAMMGSAMAEGSDRAREAAQNAVSSPLLEDMQLADAKGVLVNITAGKGLKLNEVDEVMSTIKGFTATEATVIVGTVLDEGYDDQLGVTVVATGLGNSIAPPLSVIRTGTDPEPVVDSAIGVPSVMRPRDRDAALEAYQKSGYADMDIPAFLRKQND